MPGVGETAEGAVGHVQSSTPPRPGSHQSCRSPRLEEARQARVFPLLLQGGRDCCKELIKGATSAQHAMPVGKAAMLKAGEGKGGSSCRCLRGELEELHLSKDWW